MRLKMNGWRGAQGLSVLPVAVLMCLGVVSGRALAEGVTRSVESVAGGCKITLTWEFSGKVGSDLIIEERYAAGWSVASTTVPFASLDATWFSGQVARFAVKPTLLTKPGSISFTVVAGEDAIEGIASGTWMMYLDGAVKKGIVSGSGALACDEHGKDASSASEGSTAAPTETAVAISSFQMVDGGCELAYSVTSAGTLVVEGCKGLGQSWKELKRAAASAGRGKVLLTADEVDGCCFMRMKLLTEGK